jgi:hypothetical protein
MLKGGEKRELDPFTGDGHRVGSAWFDAAGSSRGSGHGCSHGISGAQAGVSRASLGLKPDFIGGATSWGITRRGARSSAFRHTFVAIR